MLDTAGLVTTDLSDGVLTVTMCNPARRNALSEAMIAALTETFQDAATRDGVRVIVLAAEGHVFCAGHDLKEMTAARETDDRGRAFYQRVMGACATLMQTIVNHPRAIIADVRGVATAAGCQLVASCDLVVAQDDARFATPGVNIGLFCSTPMVALSRKVGRGPAMEMLLTGEMIGAARAAEFGLVNRVAPADGMDAAVTGLAKTIASKSTMTLAIGKEAFYRQAEMGLAEAYDYTAGVMVENMLTRDAEEGIGAFVEKRTPVWTDE